MGNFIEDLYYGNINPQDRSTRKNKELQEQLAILTQSEDFLTKRLPDDHKKSFIAFLNAWDIINGESALDSFIQGFLLGARFTYDTFASSASPFQSLSEEQTVKFKRRNTKCKKPSMIQKQVCTTSS